MRVAPQTAVLVTGAGYLPVYCLAIVDVARTLLSSRLDTYLFVAEMDTHSGPEVTIDNCV